jgi:pimeloyl-ACP methyl ester carboxylesterase
MRMQITVSPPQSGKNLKISVPGTNDVISYDLFHQVKEEFIPIVYLPGLVREKNEAKSVYLQSLCKKASTSFLAADYYGVGRSDGSFQDGSISRWMEDSIYLIDTLLAKKKVILVGHGMGAWISFLIAQKRPDLVSGIVGLSADPDFTEELLWRSFSDEIKEQIMSEGSVMINWGKEKYPITRKLIEDGRKNLLLAGEKGSVAVSCPVRLIHALYDEEVPFSMVQKLVDNISSEDASLVLIKGAQHAMEGEKEFRVMRTMIEEINNAFKGDFDLRSPASG